VEWKWLPVVLSSFLVHDTSSACPNIAWT